MDNMLDNSYDKAFAFNSKITWYPWIGRKYKDSERRLLIVGESHYVNAKDDESYHNKLVTANTNNNYTRECILESPIKQLWRSNTFENGVKAIIGSSEIDRNSFWSKVCYYNFIQRLMDYRYKERPTFVDFYSSWEQFIFMISVLKPTDCIFLGVSASNSFHLAMQELGIAYTPVQWKERIGSAYSRSASITIENNPIKLSFMQHPSKMFSWKKWHNFLRNENPELIKSLNSKSNFSELNDGIEDENVNDDLEINVPRNLSHKPIIAADYQLYANDGSDAMYLSLGRAQYNINSASVKLFRHTGTKWSRRSEEIPIDRVPDLLLILLTSISKIYNENYTESALIEKVIVEEDLEFLRKEIEENKDRLKTSLIEIKRIINKLDLDNF